MYGEVGKTYELQIRRPKEDRLPFLCYLNFTAAGQEFGDLVQVYAGKCYIYMYFKGVFTYTHVGGMCIRCMRYLKIWEDIVQFVVWNFRKDCLMNSG